LCASDQKYFVVFPFELLTGNKYSSGQHVSPYRVKQPCCIGTSDIQSADFDVFLHTRSNVPVQRRRADLCALALYPSPSAATGRRPRSPDIGIPISRQNLGKAERLRPRGNCDRHNNLPLDASNFGAARIWLDVEMNDPNRIGGTEV
jgi:hypothetical protein